MIQDKFAELAKTWSEETGGTASPEKKCANVNYLRIIKLGGENPLVITLILRELERKPNDWFRALEVLTEQNPITPQDQESFKRVTKAWLKWGKDNNHL